MSSNINLMLSEYGDQKHKCPKRYIDYNEDIYYLEIAK